MSRNRYEVAYRMRDFDGKSIIFTPEKPLQTRLQAKKAARREQRRGLPAFVRQLP